MYKKILTVTVICYSILLTGCSGFKANNLPEVTATELTSSTNKKIKVFSSWVVTGDSESDIENNQAGQDVAHKEYFEEALESASCCIIVENSTDADVVVNGTVYVEDYGLAIIPAFITGLTLHAIPSWFTHHVDLSVEAKVGGKVTSYKLKDSSKSVHWLPLIFAMPFTGSKSSVDSSVKQNTHNNLILQMKSDGVFN